MNTARQLGYGRNTARVADFKGVSHFDAKFHVKGLRFAPIFMDR